MRVMPCFVVSTCLLLLAFTGLGRAQAPRTDLDEWTQFTGSADHNNFRAMKDRIRNPVILWSLPDARGLPAVSRGKVYAPGPALTLADLETGKIIHSVPAGDEVVRGAEEEEWYEEEPADEREQYRRRARQESRAAFHGTPVVLADRVVAVKLPGAIVAFSLDLKKQLWETSLEEQGPAYWGYFSPACDGKVIVLSGGPVVGISPADGKILWTFRCDGAQDGIAMAPAIWQGRVFFANASGELFCLEAMTGKEVWRKKHACEFGWSSPAVVEGVIFLADRGNRGRTIRDGEEDDPPATEDDRRVSRGGALNAFSASNGERIWLTKFGATGSSAPGIGPDVVFTGTGVTVRVYDRKTGTVDASKVFPCPTPNPFGSPTLVGESMIFGSLGGRLYVYDYASKDLRWTFSVESVMRDAQVHGFAYLGCGILLLETTAGVYALGQNPETAACEEGFNLSAGEGFREFLGRVVGVKAYANNLSLFVVKSEEGATVELASTAEALKFWLRESWKGSCKVRVKYRKDQVAGKMLNRIVKIEPTR